MPEIYSPPLTRDPSPKDGINGRNVPADLTATAIADWKRLQSLLNGEQCRIDGESLDVASVVAVAKYGGRAHLVQDTDILDKINKSIQVLHGQLQHGHLVYGVTTGFGGSADTRTSDVQNLQRALIQHQNSGVLSSADIGHRHGDTTLSNAFANKDVDKDWVRNSIPTSWVRASMLTRINSLIRGHSGVRVVIADTIMSLLNHNLTPVVPLRGSISASGDLSPLSYIAGAIEGSPDIYVRCADGTVKTADKALADAGVEPVILAAKEGLGLLNGTAFSAATATLALHQAQDIAILSQILTAMAVEALQGSAESFLPQIAQMRPHPGQIESAANILSYLDNSRLASCVRGPKDTKMHGLYQDRYPLRTASQWVGPQIEDLLHAHKQLTIELNSTTDNPLIDVDNEKILHGGNFQAAVVTSTMDRTRICLERIGKMLFSQATELINPMLNNGLPPNLCADDPSLSFTCKGIDINMAAYMSELSFLANPVGNHVQSAEMHNQAINSLALISSRYTLQALDVVYLMCSAYLFALCQALDLRALQHMFIDDVEIGVFVTFDRKLALQRFHNYDESQRLQKIVWNRVRAVWPTTTSADLHERCKTTAESVLGDLVKLTADDQTYFVLNAAEMLSFTADLEAELATQYETFRTKLFSEYLDITPKYLGDAAKRIYTFVRKDLGVKLHEGLIEHPTQPLPAHMDAGIMNRKTIGTRISVIYEALRDGRGSAVIMAIAEEGMKKRLP